jgi:hypothetical protein
MLDAYEKVDYTAQYQSGIQNFAKLFRLWMDTNGWSHPVMTSLLKGALDGCAWLHSSQISGFRHARTRNPGPRAFVAIERLNHYLHRFATERVLIPGTSNSNHYSQPFVILENGDPPPVGWWFEIFTGVRLPLDYDLDEPLMTESEAERISRNLARWFRRAMAVRGYDPLEDLPLLLKDLYPIREPSRQARVLGVLRSETTWSASELQEELTALTKLSAALDGPATEEGLLDLGQQS